MTVIDSAKIDFAYEAFCSQIRNGKFRITEVFPQHFNTRGDYWRNLGGIALGFFLKLFENLVEKRHASAVVAVRLFLPRGMDLAEMRFEALIACEIEQKGCV